MSIHILNYEDSEIVRTPVVVIKGIFDLDCECTNEIQLTVHFVRNTEGNSQNFYSKRIVENGFVILTELFVGLNNLCLRVKCPCNNHDLPELEQDNRSSGYETRLDLIYEPNTNDIFVQPLIVYCTNAIVQLKSPDPPSKRNAQQISLALQLVQTYFSDQLFEHGMERRSFTCTNTPISFALLMSPQNMKELNTDQVWSMLAKELMIRPGIWNENCKYVAFMDSPWGSDTESVAWARACAKSFDTGGLAIIPLSFTAVWPESISQVYAVCDDNTIITKGNGLVSVDSTIGKVYSQTMGCLAHEIGHTFDLGHTKGGLMGCNYMDYTLSLCPSAYSTNAFSRKSKCQGQTEAQRPVYTFEGRKALQLATLGKISADLLFFHRGFLSSKRSESGSTSKLELINNIVYSSAGIAVVDLRDEDGFILNEWSFLTGVKILKFPITKKEISSIHHHKKVEVLVEDFEGNILKKQLDLNSLPVTSFTKLQR